jgi:hypothetical protein
MNPLIMMYVFFDNYGDIKAITSTPDDHFVSAFQSATFPLSEVEPFLLAIRSPSDYQVKEHRSLAGVKFKIIKKVSHIDYTRNLDNYLTKIENFDKKNSTVSITNITYDKVISVEISKEFKEFAVTGSGDDDERKIIEDFLNKGPTTIYLTKENNPFHLLFNFTFTPHQLFENETLYFNCNNKYTNTSAYTKKLIDGYGFTER